MRVSREVWDDQQPPAVFETADTDAERRRILKAVREDNRVEAFPLVAQIAAGDGGYEGRIRRAAMSAVSTIGEPDAIYAVALGVAADESAEYWTRMMAVEALSDLEESVYDERLPETLIEALTDGESTPENESKRRQFWIVAFKLLATCDPDLARRTALTVLSESRQLDERKRAIARALSGAESAIVDEQILQVLERIATDTDGDGELQEAAVDALVAHWPDRAGELARRLLTDGVTIRSSGVQKSLVSTLDGSDEGDRTVLRTVLDEQWRSTGVRIRAAKELATSGTAADLQAVCDAFGFPTNQEGGEGDYNVSFSRVAETLLSFDPEAVRPVFEAVAADTSARNRSRHAAIEGLGTLGDTRSVPVLMSLLDSEEEKRRRRWSTWHRVVSALSAIGSDEALDALIEGDGADLSGMAARVADGSADPWRRRNAAEALGEAGDERSVPVLQSVLLSEDLLAVKHGQSKTARALAEIGTEPAYQTLVAAIEADTHIRTTFAAAKQLAWDQPTCLETQTRIDALDRALQELSAAPQTRWGPRFRTRQLYESLGELQADANLASAVEAAGSYDGEYYPRALVKPALAAGRLDYLRELVTAVGLPWTVASPLIEGLVEQHESLGLSEVGDFLLWLLDPETGSYPNGRHLSPLETEAGEKVIGYLRTERPADYRQVVLALVQEHQTGLRLLDDLDDGEDRLQACLVAFERLGQYSKKRRRRLLNEIASMDPLAADDAAVAALKERLDWLSIGRLLDRGDERVVDLLCEYLEVTTRPQSVGSLAAALRDSPADSDIVFEAIREKYRDPSFYHRLRIEHEGYNTAIRYEEEPGRLLGHLHEIDRERAIETFRADLAANEITALRQDLLSALGAYLSEDEYQEVCQSLLDDSDPAVRLDAALALTRRGEVPAVSTLQELVLSSGLDLSDRKSAVAAIGNADEEVAVNHLIEIIEADHDYDVRGEADSVRAAAVTALAQQETVEAMRYLQNRSTNDGAIWRASSATLQAE
ncbi:HEAT repeat domain-containing protein [Halomicroarcula sp. F28]|uniref:HEAT repeat domain-containing protein n=1 Tax=Haloarcula salinisoli TaxID=2487746 RepID=UPI001C72C6AA|nr:HEAT repeat domain-containing protein [Halomicroarcula salinisoli]MBX0288569.1 HEAT repeat domain-containing protein [Halomicroarcula salinisoli]